MRENKVARRLSGIDDPRLSWTLAALDEECSIEGNCSAIDPETDAETARWIRGQLAAGNGWAWCCACVAVTFETDDAKFEGRAHLGCCSYRSEREFREDAYYQDMRADAFEDLLSSMRAAVTRGEVAAAVLPIEVRS